MADEIPAAYDLNRAGTLTALSVDLSLQDQTLADGTQLSGVKRIHFLGGEGADTVIGGAFSDTLSGGGGADLLQGGGGDDVLIGGTGDTLLGGEGQDQFTISSAPAQIQGGAGQDTLVITGASTFAAGSLSQIEQIWVNRGLKVDFSKLSVGQNAASGAGTSGGVYLIGSTGADTLTGGAGADTLEGGSGADILQGGDGADRLSGGPGNDSLYGGAGDDVLETKRSTGPDYFDGGDGVDRVVADFLTATADMRLDLTHTNTLQAMGGGSFIINVERIDLTSGSGADILIGGTLSDTLNGGAGDDILAGAGGDDRLTGGAGADTVRLAGARAQYSASASGADIRLVDYAAARDGTDLVSETELFQFADGTFTLAQLLRPEITDLDLSGASLAQTALPGAVVGVLSASVQDAVAALTYSLAPDETRFGLQGGQLVLTQSLGVGVYQVAVLATDSRGAQRQEIFDITITDVDEPPSQLTISNLVALAENTQAQTRLADVAVVDPDQDPAFRVYAYSVNDPRFEVHDGGLYLKAGQVVDFETAASLTLTITATSAAGAVAADLTLAIGDQDEAPSQLTISNLVALAENTQAQTRLADVAVVDPDQDPAFRVYAYSVNDPRFEVHDGGLYLKAGQVVDFETAASLTLTITATSAAGAVAADLTLAIGDQDEAPSQLTISNLVALAENTQAQTRLADVAVVDPDQDPAFRVYAYSVNDPRFEVHDGGLYLKAGQVVDFETAASLTLTITATSAAGAVAADLTLAIGDQDEAPSQLTISNLVALAENTQAQTRLADVAVVDPDQDPAFRVYAYSVNDPRFEVHDGGLYLKAGQVVDFETAASLTLTITATSAAGAVAADLTLAITDVDEIPAAYDLNRAGTLTALSVDLSLQDQTLADGTQLSGVKRIHFLGGEGADTVIGGAFSDTLSGGGGADLLQGGGGDDVLIGGTGDTLLGGEGQDQFTISSAPAQIQGGAGQDTLVITGASTFAAGSLSQIEQIWVNRGLKVDFSKLSVGQNAASGAGTSGGVYLIGSTGADTLTGGAGADTLEGGSGADILQGGDGADRLSGGPGNDSLYGGAGDDVLETKRSTGPDYFDGGDGVDRVVADFLTATADMRLDLTHTNTLQAMGGGSFIINVEQVNLVTGSGADILIGGALSDTLNGGAGDDILAGAGGNDRLSGGDGYDIAVFSGAFETYTITDQGGGQYRVTGPGQGDDILTDIETLRFSDGDRALGAVLATTNAVYWGKTDGHTTLVGATNVPDGRGATPGTGFTITGLTRAADGTWWAANEGQADENDATYTPSLVHLSADRQTKLGEINLGSPIRAVQGLAYRSNGDQLLVASLSESKVRVYNAGTGALVKIITPTTGTAPNGLAYDSVLDAAIISRSPGSIDNTTVEWRSVATGALIKSLDVGVNPDHLFFDASQGSQGVLYITYGENGQAGLIDKRDVASGVLLGRYTVPEADAIEGIQVIGDQIYLANDAYFHHGAPPLNRILQFSTDPIAWTFQRDSSALNFSVNLSVHDQTLSDGTRLVGVDRIFFQAGSGADHLAGGAYDDVLVGGEGADTLEGVGGMDRLVGGGGDDLIVGGAGDDRIEGGAGLDTARFTGVRASYSAIGLSSQSAQVRTVVGGDGTDLVSETELFQFADGTFTLAQLLRPEITDLDLSGASLAQTALPGAVVGVLSASVQDAVAALTYSLAPDETRFGLQGGQLVLTQSLGVGVYQVAVLATDSRGAQRQEIFDITITDVDEPPSQLTISNLVALAENTQAQTRLADVAVVDPDQDPAFRVYAYSVNDPRFEVHDGGLYLKAGQVVDFETAASLTLTITATSAAGAVAADLTLAIGDQDEAPSQLTISNLVALAENTQAQTRLADVAVVDPDQDPAFRVYAYSVNDPRFEVHDGGLYLKAGQVVDFETAASLTLTITATSAAGAVAADLTLAIGDQDEAPSQLTISNLVALAENTQAQTRLADVAVVDPDQDPAFRVYAYSVNDPRFEVHDGGLYLKAGQVVDFETAASLTLTITATSAAGAVAADLTLAIGDQDEAPSQLTISNLVALAENTQAQTRLADVAVVDPDQDPAFRVYAYSVNDPRFEVHDGGLYLKAGQVVDFETAASLTLTITATSAAGAVAADLTLAITDVDEIPAAYDLNRAGTLTALSVDLSLQDQTLADGTQLSGVKRIHFLGGEGADTVIGGAFSDTLSGGGGADLLQGGGGDDVLIGGTGDTLLGGEGQDQFTISSAPAQIQGGAGQDTLVITGASTFAAGSLSQIEQIWVNRGLKVDFSKLSVGQNAASGAGTSGGVYLIGSTGADTLTGGAGADTLEGGSGADILQGGDGADRLSGGPGNDSLYGGAGDDVLETKRSTGPDYFDGGDGVDRVVADFLTATADMRLDLTHTNTLQAMGGGSFIINVERIDLTSGSGADILIGGTLSDTLNGGAGDDILAGAGGDDRLTGGAGADIFRFDGAWGFDVVTDFEKGLDHLDLHATGLSFADLQLQASGASTIVHVPGFGDVTIQNVSPSGLSASDFLFT